MCYHQSKPVLQHIDMSFFVSFKHSISALNTPHLYFENRKPVYAVAVFCLRALIVKSALWTCTWNEWLEHPEVQERFSQKMSVEYLSNIQLQTTFIAA